MKIEEINGKMVITDFNELEAYKIASKIEKDGIEFYTKLFDNANPNVKDNIGIILQEERKHLTFFSNKLEEARSKIEDRFEEDDLLDRIDYGIFQPYSRIEDLHKFVRNPKEAFRLALILEEKTLKFYTLCAKKISSEGTKIELQGIIEEEKKHKELFATMLSTLA